MWTYNIVPLHFTSLGSGSHSPFSKHVVVLGPMCTNPGGQLSLMIVPSTVGILKSIILIVTKSGFPQLTAW